MRDGEAAKAEALREESRLLGNELATVEREGSKTERQLRDALLRLPNLPAPEAPDGTSEADNVVVRTVGYDPSRYGPHQRVAHWDVGAELQILDMERGAKISGSMFALFLGQGATLGARSLPAGTRPQLRRLYRGQATDPRAHAGNGGGRPVAQVRRRRLPPRARRPVGRADRRGAAHLHAGQRDTRRRGTAVAHDGLYAVLPAGGRRSWS